tara:strand:+ start:1488 stop:4148 length:2661 start_codon:yes stop_codon:yes gene_type:complete
MATITTRAGKGSPLTNTELDSNFTNLNTDKLEDADLSVTTASASSGGTLAYTSGVFTFAPADLSTYITNLSGLGVTATSAELNVLDGIPATLTTAELGYVDGVTSAIQTQLNAKGTVSTLSDLSITASATELNYASGVTSAIQAQINSKEPADSTILKDADIGSTVLAFDTNLQAFVTAFTVPTSDGTSGQALITDGSGTIAFGNVDALPSQSGNNGYYLKTNGTDASWAAVNVGQYVYVRTLYTATSGQTSFSAAYDVGYVDVFLNGIKILLGTEFTASNGTSITLVTGATTGDLIEILAYSTYNLANVYTQTQSNARFAEIVNVYSKTDGDARYAQKANNLSDLASAPTALTNLGLTATATELNVLDGIPASLTATELGYVDGVTSNIQTQIDNIDALPSQTGNADKFLTTNGSAASWGEVSSSPTLEAVASGTLANGDTIIVNANGTVSAVSEVDAPTWTAAASYTSSIGLYTALLYVPNTNKVVVAFKDSSNSNYGTAIVGVFSGSTISWGTPYVYESSATGENTQLSYSPVLDKVVVFYGHNGNGNLRGRVGTISGDTISFGSATVSLDPITNASDILAVSYDSTADKFLVCGRSTSNYLKAVVATMSATTITYGAIGTIESSSTTFISASYNSAENKHLVAWKSNDTDYGNAKLVTISGTGFSSSTATVFNSSNVYAVRTAYEATSETVVIVYCPASSTDVRARAVDMSSANGTFGTEVTIDSASQGRAQATSNNNDKIYTTYNAKIAPLTVSGTTITVGTPTNYSATDHLAIGLAYNSLSDNYVAIWTLNNPYNGIYNIFTATATTLTVENYIGISDAAYSSGATAKIQIVGSVDDAQTGLTAGQSYYIAKNGDLSLSPSAISVVAGTAVSATKIIVKG